MKPKILVTSAAGKTGMSAALQLLEKKLSRSRNGAPKGRPIPNPS